MIDSNDGGVDITTNGGETWYAPPLPIGQFYHVSCDNRDAVPRHAGCMQDIGTAAGPSNSLDAAASRSATGTPSAAARPASRRRDPTDPNIVYAGEYGGYISRYDHRTAPGAEHQHLPVQPVRPRRPRSCKYRFQWTAPILDLAARSEGGLPRRQRAVPHARRRPDLDSRSAAT